MDVYDILTRGTCSDYKQKIEKNISNTIGDWYLNNWNNEFTIDIGYIHISDSSFQLFTTKKI
jgi:hypothetical protein